MTILFTPALNCRYISTQGDLLSRIFVFDRYGELLHMLQNSIFAGCCAGLIGGFVGIVMMRDHAFAVHGISGMSFAGAAHSPASGLRRKQCRLHGWLDCLGPADCDDWVQGERVELGDWHAHALRPGAGYSVPFAVSGS